MERATFSYESPGSLLCPDPDQRDRTDPAYIEYRDTVLRPDIRRRGIQVPLLAYLENGKKRLFDGGTRLECSLLDGIELVPVLTYPCPPSAGVRRIATFLANENRLDWTPAERGRFYLQTMRDEGWTPAEMCRQIPGLKPARISKTLKWLEHLPAEFHDRVGEGQGLIPERGAYAICDFPPGERKELCEQFIAGHLTVEALEQLRRKQKGGGKPKVKPVKGKGKCLSFSFATDEHEVALAETLGLAEAIRKAQRHGLPLSSLPSLFKS